MRMYYRRRSLTAPGWKRNRTQSGYSLVGVTVVGLLMLLIAMMMLFRSQSDQAIVRAQLLKSQSLALAETAAVTYQSFLVHYPDLASHNKDQWANFAHSVASDCSLASVFDTKDIQQINAVADLGTNWQPLNPSDLSQGQIRLVDYQYAPDPGVAAFQAPGTATLRVEGRARAKGVASEAFGFGSSRSQVELQFRVDPKPPEEMPVGLVGNQFSATTNAYGSPEISANICDLGATKSARSLTTYMKNMTNGNLGTIAYSNSFTISPPTEGASPLTGLGVQNLDSFALGTNEVCQLPMLGNSLTSEGLPQNCPTLIHESSFMDEQGKPVYQYNLNELLLGSPGNNPNEDASAQFCKDNEDENCSINANPSNVGNARLILGRTGNEVIHLYVAGQTSLKQSRITVKPGTRVYLYLHGSFDATDPTPEGFLENSQDPVNLQIYVWGSAGSTNFNLNHGHSTSKAFIFAPQASVSLINVEVDGAIWANNISMVGASKVIQSVSDPTTLKIVVPGRKRINPAFNWQQREVS